MRTVCCILLAIGAVASAIVEKEHIYKNEDGGELVGFLMYQDVPGSPKRPGLLMFPGPYGDGGGAAERAIGRSYAEKGMVVFLADYFTGRHSENVAEDVRDALGKYGPFLVDTVMAQKIALLGLEQLTSLDITDATNVGVIGFCFGGAMTLNLARAGGDVKVAVSLHGEYPLKGEATGEYKVGYFVQMVGKDDPLILPAERDFWIDELANYTANTEMGYDMQIWGDASHGFSVKYTDTFYAVIASAFGTVTTPNGVEGIIKYEERRAAESFDRVNDLFTEYGLISSPASAACDCSADTASLEAQVAGLTANLSCESTSDCAGLGFCSPNTGSCKTLKRQGEYCNVVQKCKALMSCVDKICV